MNRIGFVLAIIAIFVVACVGAFGAGMYAERLHADRQLNAMKLKFDGDKQAAVNEAYARGYEDDQEIAQYNFSRGAFAWCVESGGDPFECNEDVQAWWQIRWQVFTEGFVWRNP